MTTRPLGYLLAAMLVWVCAAALGAVPPTDVWLDVDTANGVGDVDDGLMVIQALHSPEARVRGISVVFGNTDLDKAEHVAREIVRRFAGWEMPVHRGAASRADLGASNDAVEAMAAALREAPMTIAAVGPVTNIGSLLLLHPDLRGRIERIIVVAGRRPGQVFLSEEHKGKGKTPPNDFNFELDPAAMQVILDSGIAMVLAPWEVSSKVWVSREDLRGIADRTDAGAWVDRTSQYWIDRWESGLGVAAFNPYDTLAIGWLTHPGLVSGFPALVRIERGPDERASEAERNAGKTKPYLHARPAEGAAANALYLSEPAPEFKALLLDRLAGPASSGGAAEAVGAFDHSEFDAVVRTFVDGDGMVNYRALVADHTGLDRYIATLASADLDAMERDERLALLLNAYNAFTLALVIEHWHIGAIKDIPEERRWKAARWNLGGRTVSLDTIEHEMIRPVFGDPRVHFALVCAGRDCPPLRGEAYTGWWMDAQLDDQARRFHAGERWLRFDPATGVLQLSSIYKWYAADFGEGEAGVIHHAARYSPPLRAYLRAGKEARVQWLDYDWSLNAQRGRIEKDREERGP